ncbi:hypothetical protein IWX90DRAFT_46653 [Phyllosticta citrichinensis]|uniref:Pentatricopeptide repeat protein n=1 Tax=Phyllosticta citrichinensis TaxID=1130410 RepID=A0ABR1XHZ1_9PEZI
MRTALDRLLARPSTLRLLRVIAATHELPRTAPRRHLSVSSPTQNRSHNGAYEKQNIGDDPVAQRKALEEDIRKDVQEKLGASPTKEDAAQSTAGFTDNVQMEAWIETIQRLQRIHGSSAVKVAWEVLREDQVDLPTKGPQAHAIWGLLVAEDDLLESLVSYAFDVKRRTGQAYEKLYESIVAHFFAKQLHRPIYEWHERLIHDFPPAPGGLKMIASHVHGSTASYKAFRWIYHRNTQHDVYDTIIPSLYKQGKPGIARNLQVWLLSRGDIPRGSRRAEGIEEVGKLPSPTRGRYRRKNVENPNPSGPFDTTAVYVRQLEALGMRPKQVDDEFCARLFATTALSINFAVDCLLMMGCDEIGPLSMREMAFRSGDCKSVVKNSRKIAASGMAIKSTTYNRAIMRLAAQNRQGLLQSLLDTDQHPDNFDDRRLQYKLLNSYIRANNWPGINRTLAILTISNPDADNEGWNILVRVRSKTEYTSWNAHIAGLSRILEEADSKGFNITNKTLDALIELLRTRKPGRAPETTPEPGIRDDVWFANVCCLALRTGTKVSTLRWRELFRRFGMTERFDHVFHLALWLTDFYTTTHNLPEHLLREFNHYFNNDADFAGGSVAKQDALPRQPTDVLPSHAKHPLRKLFNALTLRAFVAWSIRRDFIVPHKSSKKQAHYWTRGLVLLRLLRQSGVHVSEIVVRKELHLQLLRLYGRLYGIHDPLLRRRFRLYERARRNNPYTLAEMVQQANEAFCSGTEGDTEEPLLDIDKVAEYIVETGRSRLWKIKRWRIRQQPGLKKRVRKPQPKGDLWTQLKL